jgi:hypothetical protein
LKSTAWAVPLPLEAECPAKTGEDVPPETAAPVRKPRGRPKTLKPEVSTSAVAKKRGRPARAKAVLSDGETAARKAGQKRAWKPEASPGEVGSDWEPSKAHAVQKRRASKPQQLEVASPEASRKVAAVRKPSSPDGSSVPAELLKPCGAGHARGVKAFCPSAFPVVRESLPCPIRGVLNQARSVEEGPPLGRETMKRNPGEVLLKVSGSLGGCFEEMCGGWRFLGLKFVRSSQGICTCSTAIRTTVWSCQPLMKSILCS